MGNGIQQSCNDGLAWQTRNSRSQRCKADFLYGTLLSAESAQVTWKLGRRTGMKISYDLMALKRQSPTRRRGRDMKAWLFSPFVEREHRIRGALTRQSHSRNEDKPEMVDLVCQKLQPATVAVQSLNRAQLFYSLMNSSPPGFSVHRIFQARTLEWVAICSSRGSSWSRDQTRVSCIGRWILCHGVTREAWLSHQWPISVSDWAERLSLLPCSLTEERKKLLVIE